MKKLLFGAICLIAFGLLSMNTAFALSLSPEIVNVENDGSQAMSMISIAAGLNQNGRFVTFVSSHDFVDDDTNVFFDVYLRDLRKNTTVLISTSTDGTIGNDDSFGGSLNSNGRYVGFTSLADNLVSDDNNDLYDVFVRDLKKGTTTRVSLSDAGDESNGSSFGGSMSSNGRFVTFRTDADNLVPNDNNGQIDVFVRDLKKGTTTRVSVSSDGQEANAASFGGAISPNGRFIAFQSAADNLVPNDNNGQIDVFVRDLKKGTTTRVSVDSNGQEGNASSFGGSFNKNGRFIVFESLATNFFAGDTNNSSDVFVYDMKKGNLELVSMSTDGDMGNDRSRRADISGNGRFIVFESLATNLVENDNNGVSDIFLFDRKTKTTTLVSVSSQSEQGNDESTGTGISLNGKKIVYSSDSSNLISNDSNGNLQDVFITKISKR